MQVDTHDLVAVSERRQQHVERVLAAFFSDSHRRAAALGATYAALWQTLERNASGGKRFRPLMVMASYEALGGTDIDAAAHVGAAFELLHTALIVHDDVIDRDFVRRGGPNVSGSYRDIATTAGIPLPTAEHRGMSVAIIAGDLALFNSYRLIDKSGAADNVRARLLEVMDEALFASAAGELIDVDFSIDPAMPRVDDILTMERLKTAVYSFESPLQAGAVLAGAPEEAIDALGLFGRLIGVAFQLTDDLLGVFGDPETTGKSVLADLREGKQTALIAHASATDQWPLIAPFLGKHDLTEAEADQVRNHLRDCGAPETADALAREYASRAVDALEIPVMPDVLRVTLTQLALSAVTRRK